MADRLIDEIPDDELVNYARCDQLAYWSWIADLQADIRERVAEVIRDIPSKETIWLAEYLNPDGPAYGRAEAAAKIAFPSKSGHYRKDIVWQVAQRMLLKYHPVIKAYLDECGYTPEKIKMHTSRWFTMKEPKFQKVSGAVDPDKLPPNARIIAETGLTTMEGRGDSRHEVYGDGDTLIEIQTESPHQLKALELASRHQGMLKDKVDHEFPNGIPVVASLSDDDRTLIKAGLEAAKQTIMERHLAKIADADQE